MIAPTDQSFLQDVRCCSRCGGDHDSLKFARFINLQSIFDVEVTHWAMCPTTCEPVLLWFEADEMDPSPPAPPAPYIDPQGEDADKQLLEVFYRQIGLGLEVHPAALLRGIRGVRAFQFASSSSRLAPADVQRIIEALDFCIGDSDRRANSGNHHRLRQRLKRMIATLPSPATPPAPEVGETGEVDPSPPRPAQEPKCFPNAIHRCSNCQSEGLEWGSYVQLVAAGMGPDKAKPIFALGCVDCSETLRVVDAEDVATWMNKQMSTATPPAPEPGEVDELIHCLRIREQSLGSEDTNLVQLRDAAFFGRAATRLEQQESELAALVQQLAEPAKVLVVPATPPAPEPGEVGELVEFLTPTREQAGAISLDAFLKLRRAATLLQQQEAELAALVQQLAEPAKALVVPVNEQPWNRPGWCDAEGRCWLCNSYSMGRMGRWNYDTPPDPAQDWGRLGTVTHSAPHWAIPRPGRMPELPSLSVYSYDAGESVRISRMGESNCWCIIASGLIPDWWFNLEMHYDFASAGAALAAIRLAQQTAKKSEET
jgi:hypothetical protein